MIKFSPDGSLVAVGLGKLVQIWRSPGFSKDFFPFELLRTFLDFADKITALDWSPDSKYLIVGSKDLTARLLSLKKLKRRKPMMFLGHRDSVVGAFFGLDKKTNRVCKAYTVTRDCYILSWTFTCEEGDSNEMVEGGSEPPSPGTPDRDVEGNIKTDGNDSIKKRKNYDSKDAQTLEDDKYLCKGKWELLRKDNFMQAPAKLTACDYHRELDMIVVGFSNGVFGLYQMPEFVCLHLLSISREKITTAVFNELGNWLTFGCAKLGQLLVWEWRSESYILKQQGHYFDVNCLAYSPDSQILATGADDNKVKVNKF